MAYTSTGMLTVVSEELPDVAFYSVYDQLLATVN